MLLLILIGLILARDSSGPGVREVLQVVNQANGSGPTMAAVDDSRWFEADAVVSASLGEAVPMYAPCPSPRTPEFEVQFRDHHCSVIIVADDEDRFLFWGWNEPVRQREVGENVTGAVDDIHKVYGDRYFLTRSRSFAPPPH